MTASRVEVSKESSVPLLDICFLAFFGCLRTFCSDVVADHQLRGVFGVSVGIGGAKGAVLGDWNHVRKTGSIAVDGGRRGIDDVGDVIRLGRFQETECAIDIGVVVVKRDFSRFADSLE